MKASSHTWALKFTVNMNRLGIIGIRENNKLKHFWKIRSSNQTALHWLWRNLTWLKHSGMAGIPIYSTESDLVFIKVFIKDILLINQLCLYNLWTHLNECLLFCRNTFIIYFNHFYPVSVSPTPSLPPPTHTYTLKTLYNFCFNDAGDET